MPRRKANLILIGAFAALSAAPAQAGEIACDLADHRAKAAYLSSIYQGECAGLDTYKSAPCEAEADQAHARRFGDLVRTRYRVAAEALCTVFKDPPTAEAARKAWSEDYRKQGYKVVETNWKPQ